MGYKLNEEIRRIKTLFTEERLYGNLVEQSKDDIIGGGTAPTGTIDIGGNSAERPVYAAKFNIKKDMYSVEYPNVLLTITRNYQPNIDPDNPTSYLNNVPTGGLNIKINGDKLIYIKSNGSVGNMHSIGLGLSNQQKEYLANFIVTMVARYQKENDGTPNNLTIDLKSPKSRNKFRNKIVKDILNSQSTSSKEDLNKSAEEGNVLITDVSFPDLDSSEVCQTLKSDIDKKNCSS